LGLVVGMERCTPPTPAASSRGKGTLTHTHSSHHNTLTPEQAFSRKLKRAIGRFEMDTARRMYETRPMYTLDHLIKERYPRFGDALGDLDDALSMLHLFASFPAEPPIKADITAMAKRLCREWQYYCARSRSLRKVFFSIKGVYYQAEVGGVTVTWLQPWQFSQALPCDVDYKVMLTFLELHEVRSTIPGPPPFSPSWSLFSPPFPPFFSFLLTPSLLYFVSGPSQVHALQALPWAGPVLPPQAACRDGGQWGQSGSCGGEP